VNFTPTKRLVRDGRQLEHPIALAIGDVEVASTVDGHPVGSAGAGEGQRDLGAGAWHEHGVRKASPGTYAMLKNKFYLGDCGEAAPNTSWLKPWR
jgi:hypothetical protein